MLPPNPTLPSPEPGNLLLSEPDDRVYADLVLAIGAVAADHYIKLISQLSVPMAARCRKAFAKAAVSDRLDNQECEREVAVLTDLMRRLGKARDSFLAMQASLPASLVRSIRLQKGIVTFDYTGQVPESELGTVPDGELAERYGVPAYVVASARTLRGIAEPDSVYDELAREMPLLVERLGRAMDTELAAQFDLSVNRVFELRTHLAIPKFCVYTKLAHDTPDLASKLGTVSDSKLSKKYGISVDTLRGLRQHLGIKKKGSPADYRNVDPSILEMLRTRKLADVERVTKLDTHTLRKIRDAWDIPAYAVGSLFTDEVDAALGTASDDELAKRFGIKLWQLTKRRIKLGIKRFENWMPEHIALLGTDTDKAIALKLGVPLTAVFRKRTALNIPARAYAYVGKPPRLPRVKWTPENIALLGTDTDKAVAQALGTEVSSVRVKRRSLKIAPSAKAVSAKAVIPEHLVDQFNVMSDGAIATLTGHTQATISKHRRNMGITTRWNQGSLPEEANDLLGKIVDSEIAKKYGVSVQCVSARRRKLGIPATPRQAKEKTRLPEAVLS